MPHLNRIAWILLSTICFSPAAVSAASPEDAPMIAFRREATRVIITADDQPLATYVFQDDQISRPYFAHVFAPGGIQVTRRHPPASGDAQDHALFHPGIGLAFGDLGGHDYWRLRAKVAGGQFVEEPTGGAGRGTFTVRNRYLTSDGNGTACIETCRYSFQVRPDGYLVICDSRFSSDRGEFSFGDQEEMGLGVRMATPIAVNSNRGGRILNSEGRRNEEDVWGRQADWCDYSGTVDGQPAGITIMPDPDNFRRCWFHARNYGFLAANPFGRKAFSGGEESVVRIKAGESLRLRFGLLLHSGRDFDRSELQQAYVDFVRQLDDPH